MESNGTRSMLVGAVNGGLNGHIKRIALIVNDARMDATLMRVRAMVSTYSAGSLSELRAALTEHHKLLLESEERGGPAQPCCIDITSIPLDDTELFASHLGVSSQVGVVYAVTNEQFGCFPEGSFDFVVR